MITVFTHTFPKKGKYTQTYSIYLSYAKPAQERKYIIIWYQSTLNTHQMVPTWQSLSALFLFVDPYYAGNVQLSILPVWAWKCMHNERPKLVHIYLGIVAIFNKSSPDNPLTVSFIIICMGVCDEWSKLFYLYSGIVAIFNPFTLKSSSRNIICSFHTFENNFGIKLNFTKYLKEICCLYSGQRFSFKCFQKNALVREIFPKSSGLFWPLWV